MEKGHTGPPLALTWIVEKNLHWIVEKICNKSYGKVKSL